jgi:hypothetical protein
LLPVSATNQEDKMDENTDISMIKTINSMITEIERLQKRVAELEHGQKILRTESLRVKTMSDKFLPTIADLLGQNGRKGA